MVWPWCCLFQPGLPVKLLIRFRICGLFFFWFEGYLFLVIISSFEAIFCSISRHYSSKKVVILHFRKASKRVMLMSSFHVLHDWTANAMWKHCKCSKDYDLDLVWNLISIIINKSLHLLYKKLILVSFVFANLLLIFQLQQRAQLCIWDCRAVLWLFEIFLEKTVNSFKK